MFRPPACATVRATSPPWLQGSAIRRAALFVPDHPADSVSITMSSWSTPGLSRLLDTHTLLEFLALDKRIQPLRKSMGSDSIDI